MAYGHEFLDVYYSAKMLIIRRPVIGFSKVRGAADARVRLIREVSW